MPFRQEVVRAEITIPEVVAMLVIGMGCAVNSFINQGEFVAMKMLNLVSINFMIK